MFTRWLPLIALCIPLLAPGQTPASPAGSVQGRITDSVTGRPVAEAAVTMRRGDRIERSLSSDAAGQFSFANVQEGVYRVEVERAGYLRAVQTDVRVVLNRSSQVAFVLAPAQDVLAEVVVAARSTQEDPTATPNTVRLDREEIRRSPGSASDVFRALDILPGVTATGEFSNFTVRGNGPRDNLILVDGIPFDKVTHFDQSLGEQEDVEGGGRYSIFAPNIINSAKFSAGGWRAAEGGKNGSLLELEVAPGNTASSTIGARIDIIGAEVDYDGPTYILGDTSMLLSARSFDFSNLFEAIDEKDIGSPRLADVILKLANDAGGEHGFELLAIYASEDYTRSIENALASEDYQDVSLGESQQDSTLLGLTWRWSPGNVARFRNTLYYRASDKTSSQGEAYPEQAIGEPTPETTPVREDIVSVSEKETEIGWRGDFSTVLGSSGIFSAGARAARVDLEFDQRLSGDWNRYVYDQTDFRPDPAQRYIVLTPTQFDSSVNAAETRFAAYTDYAWSSGDFTWTPGLRYEYDGFADESVLAPRLTVTWALDSVSRIWAGGGVYYQAPRYLELAADPANVALKNERSTQFVLGASTYFTPDLRASAEAYYQKLDDLVLFDDRTTSQARNLGEGSAAGVDLMLAKRMTSNWSASATYSYSRARRDDNLGEGEYASDWDRPHSFGIVGAWRPNDRWTFSGKWKYASGRPDNAFVTYSDVLGGDPLRYSKEITRTNAERLPAFHSLSFRVDYTRRFGPFSLVAYIDVINVYGRENTNASEWDERRGVNVLEGLDEPLPTLGLRFEYSWMRDDGR